MPILKKNWFLKVAGTFFILGSCCHALAQGINVPAGSTLNVNAGTLDIAGDVTIAGTLLTTTGTVKSSGNWVNTGTYTPGTGTATFTKSAGTQTLNSGGTGAGKVFYNLTHSGAGTLQFITNSIDINNTFTNSAGTVDANAIAMTVAKDWSNSGTFTANGNTVTFDGTSQSLSGNTTFYNFTKSVAAADTMTFDNTATQTITGTLTMNGAAANLLKIQSNVGGAQWNISLQAGGLQVMSYLDVNDSDASGGLTLIAGATSANSTPATNVNWIFATGTTFTWQGDVSTTWSTPGNWDLGAVPGTADTAVIPDVTGGGGVQPVLTGAVSIAALTVQANATVSLNQNNLAVSGALLNSGTVILTGNETVSFGSFNVNAGTFRYTGDSDGVTENFTIKDFGAASTDYYNLEFSDSSALRDNFLTGADLTVAGTLTINGGTVNNSSATNTITVTGTTTVSGGTWTATNGNIDANGNVVISSGTLTAPTSGKTFTIAGNFNHSGGTFTHSSGTVTLDGTNQSVSGSTSFNSFNKTVTTARTLTFDSSSTQTFAGTLTMKGASGQLLSIRSSSSGSQAPITLSSGGFQDISFVDVQDSNAGGGLMLIARNSTSLVNTTNWGLTGTFTWQGDDGTTPTNWDTAANWDLGLVPSAGDTAVIPNVANQPTLATNVSIGALNISSGATVSLNGKNLTLSGALSNDGTVSLFGSETLSFGTMDTDSGTFTYTGDGNGTSTAYTLSDFGGTDYYNLIINDNHATPDSFTLGAADLTAANLLTLSAGTLDISTRTTTAAGTLSISGGTLTATNGNIDANGDVTITGGALTAPGSGKSFTVAKDWNFTGGTFTNSTGTVTFDSATTATLVGNTTFNNFTTTTAGKTLKFTAGSTQTVNGTFTVTGVLGNLVNLRSTSLVGVAWDITFPNGVQAVQFVDVKDSNANTNDVYCFNCTNSLNNNVHWIFSALSITTPLDGKTTDTTPTVIGTGATPGQTVSIKDSGGVVVATVVADANGNFRVEIPTASALALGANSLSPCLGAICGGAVNIITVASPTTSQQPTITSPTNGARVNGATPTIVGVGNASDTVTIKASDSAGNLLLSTVASGSTDASGNYTIQLTTALPKGTNYISVTVNGVASNILNVSLTDPFGRVFDSASNGLINQATVTIYRAATNVPAVPGVDLDSADVNPVTTGTDGFYSFLTASGDYYIVVSASGYQYPSVQTSFPAGRTIVTGSKGQTFTVGSTIIEMDHPVDSNGTLLRVTKDANKSEVRVGEVVTYTVTVQNLSSTNSVFGVFLDDTTPPGFKFLDGRVLLDGVPGINPIQGRPIRFNLGHFTPNQTKTLRYQLVVGSGVTQGNYENRAHAVYSDGQRLSNFATETVKVVLDPLFDMGTVIGKVFFDKNENGVQDAPEFSEIDQAQIEENPVPNVQIVMEDGTVITTDKDGKFSIPGIVPGRHLFRLDERSLPKGSYLTTEKVVVVDVTPGLLVKVNFGVNLDYVSGKDDNEQYFIDKVNVLQSKDTLLPRLNVGLFGGEIETHNNIFVDNVEFRIFTNYAAFIDQWKVEIVDKDTNKLIRSFEGNRYSINDPILWDGKDNGGDYVRFDRHYAYRLIVEGKDNKYDETPLFNINFYDIEDEADVKKYLEESKKSYEDDHRKWIEAESVKNNVKVQTILIDGETVIIDQLDANLQNVRIMQGGTLLTDIPVAQAKSVTAQDILKGNSQVGNKSSRQKIEVILPKGEYDVVVQESTPTENVGQGSENLGVPSKISGSLETQPKSIQRLDIPTPGLRAPAPPSSPVPLVSKSYSKPIKVGEDYMFFVAMGDARVGYTLTRGFVEAVQQNDQYRGGFWHDGKLAYYLKGKILGKYLVTSSFDSDRERQALFTTLDQNAYYPVYGDDSSKNYQATDTRGNLYLMIEWDKSSAMWGNYSVGFGDTEFATFSRGLYGGKVDYQSVSTTKYNEPDTKLIVFRARAQQQAAHNEFLATGGSLYYLKHKDLIEGSTKIKVQVRDAVTGLVVTEKELKSRVDYELDNKTGQIIFWQPIPILAQTLSIVSNQILHGDPIYVIADYEYELKDKYDEDSYGARAQQALTDEVVVGGTYVKETQQSKNYELKGTDVKLHLGPDITVKTEYAESISQAQGIFLSTDGGLNFTELTTDDQAKGRAYGITGDARLFNRVGLSSYYKWISDNFSTPDTTSQQGKEVYGVGGVVDLGENTRLTSKYDVQTLVNGGNPQTQLQVGATQTATTLVQLVHEARKLRLTAEFNNQVVTEKKDQFESPSNVETKTAAVKAEYQLTENVNVSAERQFTLSGEDTNQTILGATAQVTDKVKLKATETIANNGKTATTLGGDLNVNDKLTVNADYTVTLGQKAQYNYGTGTSMGATYKPDERTELKSSIGVNNLSNGVTQTTMAVGGNSQVDDKTTNETQIALTESTDGGKSATYTFGTKKKLSDDLELASSKTFGTGIGTQTTGSTYSLIRNKNGRQLQGSLTRQYSDNNGEVSNSNIYGLSGDLDDNWAISGSLERGNVQNLDGSQTLRNVVSLGGAYVYKDKATGRQEFKSSTKVELRKDEGINDTRQMVLYNASEGKLGDQWTLFDKIQYTETLNLSQNSADAKSREISVGAAFRPIKFDRLNLISQYTYKENLAPSGQTSAANIDISQEKAHILASEAIYDIDNHWQLSEKLAYRIAEEKVAGFDFARTHTWLIIQRINYKIDKDWTIGGEFRQLTQEEAQDAKRGMLIEVSRRVGEYAQLGVGYNFTDFTDDLTSLGYRAQGPFVRLTGKAYDRTADEIQRAHEKWLEERINVWAWMMVNEELSKNDSPILIELNDYFVLAQKAHDRGDDEESHRIYKDIITAGEMMFQEAAEYIHVQIRKEEEWKSQKALADQYMKNGEYEKAKKILEKILDDVKGGVVK